MTAPAAPTTGHEIGDVLLPAAMQLVDAVRTGKPALITAALDTAANAAGHTLWREALAVVLAGLVPDDVPVGELLAWTDEQRWTADHP